VEVVNWWGIKMMRHSSIWIEQPNGLNEYGLRIDIIDEDGIVLCEVNGENIVNKVYIYFVEIKKTIDKLQEVIDKYV